MFSAKFLKFTKFVFKSLKFHHLRSRVIEHRYLSCVIFMYRHLCSCVIICYQFHHFCSIICVSLFEFIIYVSSFVLKNVMICVLIFKLSVIYALISKFYVHQRSHFFCRNLSEFFLFYLTSFFSSALGTCNFSIDILHKSWSKNLINIIRAYSIQKPNFSTSVPIFCVLLIIFLWRCLSM